jgi:hypothetical protein
MLLVVSLLLDPASRILSDKEAATFVVDEDQNREWKSWEPPSEAEMRF